MGQIQLEVDVKDRMSKKIQEYLLRELDFEIGNFDAQFLLEFFSEHMGCNYYNQGLKDALGLIEGKVEEFSELIYQLEKEEPLKR